MSLRKAVGAVIEKNGKYLLGHKVLVPKYNIRLDEWGFLRGGVEEGESEEVALLRELKEETHSDSYKIIKSLGSFEFEFPDILKKKSRHKGQNNKMFLVEFTGDKSEIKPDGIEMDKLEWFTPEEVLNKLKFRNSKDFFRKNVLEINH